MPTTGRDGNNRIGACPNTVCRLIVPPREPPKEEFVVISLLTLLAIACPIHLMVESDRIHFFKPRSTGLAERGILDHRGSDCFYG